MIRANQIAYDYIRSRIIDGTFRPAERLVEAQLAQDIGVSRNTVKKVLLQIEQERLITIEDNKGARVLSLSIEEILRNPKSLGGLGCSFSRTWNHGTGIGRHASDS